MEKALYGFNSSQDVIHLQTKYSLFGRVANIVFSTVVEDGFDKDLMKKAINELIARNDCLRITFVKKDKKILQYFADNREIKNIPYLKLDSVSKQDAFINKFRLHKLNCFKGETLKVAFATNPDGKDAIFFKISHYVADTYGIGILISDLFAVYSALKEGRELPEAPGSFEEVLKNLLINVVRSSSLSPMNHSTKSCLRQCTSTFSRSAGLNAPAPLSNSNTTPSASSVSANTAPTSLKASNITSATASSATFLCELRISFICSAISLILYICQ